jgi:hypothetical protein
MAVLVFNIKHGECPTLVIYVYKLGNLVYFLDEAGGLLIHE